MCINLYIHILQVAIELGFKSGIFSVKSLKFAPCSPFQVDKKIIMQFIHSSNIYCDLIKYRMLCWELETQEFIA